MRFRKVLCVMAVQAEGSYCCIGIFKNTTEFKVLILLDIRTGKSRFLELIGF